MLFLITFWTKSNVIMQSTKNFKTYIELIWKNCMWKQKCRKFVENIWEKKVQQCNSNDDSFTHITRFCISLFSDDQIWSNYQPGMYCIYIIPRFQWNLEVQIKFWFCWLGPSPGRTGWDRRHVRSSWKAIRQISEALSQRWGSQSGKQRSSSTGSDFHHRCTPWWRGRTRLFVVQLHSFLLTTIQVHWNRCFRGPV